MNEQSSAEHIIENLLECYGKIFSQHFYLIDTMEIRLGRYVHIPGWLLTIDTVSSDWHQCSNKEVRKYVLEMGAKHRWHKHKALKMLRPARKLLCMSTRVCRLRVAAIAIIRLFPNNSVLLWLKRFFIINKRSLHTLNVDWRFMSMWAYADTSSIHQNICTINPICNCSRRV